MLKSVLYQNALQTPTLLDLPASFEDGQQLHYDYSVQREKQPLSAAPLEQPYPSLEPKGLKRAQLLADIPIAEQQYHHQIQKLISESLREIRSCRGSQKWCLPRRLATSSPWTSTLNISSTRDIDETGSEPPVILSNITNVFKSVDDISERVVSNPYSTVAGLQLGHDLYRIPPHSRFLLSDVRRCCPLSLLSKTLDIVLMDPPWPNRSVRNAHAYQTSDGQNQDPFLCVLPFVQSHLKPSGLVGVWVTNKASVRDLVLTWLFQLGFGLYQEWIWMKTTIRGEPVTPLDGIWRRPYEVLLLFRREAEAGDQTRRASEPTDLSIWTADAPRRVFVAVPDHHSRKPCLKPFLEQLLPDSSSYEALEIFARTLTAGWICWGDEVLKFNWEGHWADANGSD